MPYSNKVEKEIQVLAWIKKKIYEIQEKAIICMLLELSEILKRENVV